MKIYCCLEDVELAFQEIIDTFERPPIIEQVDNSQVLSTACGYCKKPAVYIVTNECSHT